MTQKELGTHIKIVYLVPINDKMDVAIGGGPSFMRLSRDIASASVVNGAAPSRKTPPHLRGIYGVCPSCRSRAPLPKRVTALTCKRCQQEFEVDWGGVPE